MLHDLVSNQWWLSLLHLPADILNDKAFAGTLDQLLECVEVEEYQAHIWEGNDDNIWGKGSIVLVYMAMKLWGTEVQDTPSYVEQREFTQKF